MPRLYSFWRFDYSLRGYPCYNVVESPEQRLKTLLEDLSSYYQSTLGLPDGGVRLVCDFSSNYFRYQDACYLADWLHENQVQLRALCLAHNRITCKDWEEVAVLAKKFRQNVRWLHLGANRFPDADEANPALNALQQDGHVSLATTAGEFETYSASPWSQQWDKITSKVEEVIYGPDEG